MRSKPELRQFDDGDSVCTFVLTHRRGVALRPEVVVVRVAGRAAAAGEDAK